MLEEFLFATLRLYDQLYAENYWILTNILLNNIEYLFNQSKIMFRCAFVFSLIHKDIEICDRVGLYRFLLTIMSIMIVNRFNYNDVI